MTSEEYLEGQYGTTDITGPVLITTVIAARHYGDLRAKEAVKEFAEELMLHEKQYRTLLNERILTMAVRIDHIKHLAKQKGVEI